MANVRGNLYGVVDIGAYKYIGLASRDANSRILMLAERYSFNVALLVDRVVGLRDAREWQQSEGSDTQVEYRDEHGATWHKLDIHGLLEQVEFLQIGN